ncbi:hypothetical protein MAA_11654 [Metarhizium robertsii ARSEF 23]|nr:uncharacterized protein MAA_11654 [Metarhizium robertsii ARSEF 23]KHO10745.1 hypothetical protein MAA_11654 [Metarhizium robertsii ARSEF 23]
MVSDLALASLNKNQNSVRSVSSDKRINEAFNADSCVAHFYCDYSAYHVPFNLPNKTQEEILSVTQEFLAIKNDNWGFTTRYIQSDGEKGLGKKWKDFVIIKGITFNPPPPDTPDQNGDHDYRS